MPVGPELSRVVWRGIHQGDDGSPPWPESGLVLHSHVSFYRHCHDDIGPSVLEKSKTESKTVLARR